MTTIGVTGGIASGKSAAMCCLRELGCICFSADEAARAVIQPHGPLIQRIVFRFGPSVLDASGWLNRAALGDLIFRDDQARAALNAIMHPAIINLLLSQVECTLWDFPHGTVVAIEVPLLFESNLQVHLDYTINIEVPEPLQVTRLITRNHLSREDAIRRIHSQMSNAERRHLADVTVTNIASRSALQDAISKFLCTITSSAPVP